MFKRHFQRHAAKEGVARRAPFDGNARLRPGERVMQYLLAEFDRPDLKEGSRLPTIRELAARLKVSIFTVQQVFNKLSLQGRIRAEIGNGTFLVSGGTRKSGRLTIALGIPTPSVAPHEEWHYRIYGGMLNAVARANRSITLLPLSQTQQDTEAALQKLLNERSQVDGLILFPCSQAEIIRAAYEREGRCVVHLNPPTETATANFVAPDYFGASRKLAEVWKQSGRRRLLLLLTAARDSVSRRLRIAGFTSGLDAEMGRGISLQIIETSQWREEGGYQAMRRFLTKNRAVPDAICCEGDFLAVGALRALQEFNIRVPEDASVVAGSGLHITETLYPQLTRTRHPLEQVGENLVAMLCERVQAKGAAIPALILETPFIGGATTRDGENELLEVQNDASFLTAHSTLFASDGQASQRTQ
ncbi:MAG: LacI family DNA-binding transcriptional regulator [Verrucomicrobia bacterium]|nr:LacI family DNA-binding transcriptional regulator [Verrucomicrobiota bacterium]